MFTKVFFLTNINIEPKTSISVALLVILFMSKALLYFSRGLCFESQPVIVHLIMENIRHCLYIVVGLS